MQRKMDQQTNPQNRKAPTVTTDKLAEKHSEAFLQQVLYPRGIKVTDAAFDNTALESLREHLGNPEQSELKQVLGNAFVEFDVEEAALVFATMERHGENEAMHEAEYRRYFLKSGLYGSINTVCRCIQKKMIVDGSKQRTWMPLPAVIDRRESGIIPSTMVWDIVNKAYPGKVGNSKGQDTYFIPDHLYAVNGRDKMEQDNINSYVGHLPGFLLMEERDGMKPPYLIQESKDHKDKEREARQYLSLLTASALHDRMLLRWLSDEAQKTEMIALDPEFCIYGMTCCGVLVTLYKMSIRDVWSNFDTSKVGKPVRYDFVRVENFTLSRHSHCTRLSDWMNTLHFYAQTSLAESMMQDGGKAHSSMKVKPGDWKGQLSQVVFLYGEKPNTVTFSTEYAGIGNNDNDDNEDDNDGEGNEDNEDGRDNGDNEDGGDNEDNDPNPKRRKLSPDPCNHPCRTQAKRGGGFCTHPCCKSWRKGQKTAVK
jgi:hypothetical protein